MLACRVPYDFRVDYLESSGTQYIDTNIIVQENDTIEVEAMFLNKSGDNFLLGSSGLTDEGSTWVEVYANNTHYVRFGSSSSISRSGNAAENMNVWRTYKIKKSNFYVDGVKKLAPGFASMPSRSLTIFGRKSSSVSKGLMKIRTAKVIRGETLVINLISCRIGQVGYMYDTVSRQLFGNSGTGNFILGNDIT